MQVRGEEVETVVEPIAVGALELIVVRPRDSDALLDEDAFEHEEFLPYWAELWPSAVALGRAVNARVSAGAAVLELGCGLALPSIVAALRGARSLATDWSPDALAFASRNAALNGAAVETALCSWSEPSARVTAGRWDLVLASDVLYERRNVELLLALLPRLVRRDGEVLLAEPGRPAAAAFLAAAEAAWVLERLPGEAAVYSLRPR